MNNNSSKLSGKELLDLFLCTFKIGALTFGGGYVIIPLLEREFTERRGYIDKDDILDIVAISQSLPGAIAINACIMGGYRAGGVKAALACTLGVTLPSLITLSILTYFYAAFADNQHVAAAFKAISAAVVALMLSAMIKLGKSVLKSPLPWIIMVLAVLGAFQFGFNSIYLIIASGVAGFAFSFTPLGYDRDGDKEKSDG